MTKIFTTNTQKETEGLKPTSFRPIMTGERNAGLDDSAYCIRFALPEEWAAFRRKVADRVAHEPDIWSRCDKCGLVSLRPFRSDRGTPCVKCNWSRFKDGGHMRDMTPAQVKEYQAAEAAKNKTALERMRKAREYNVNESRKRQGLEPLPAAKEK